MKRSNIAVGLSRFLAAFVAAFVAAFALGCAAPVVSESHAELAEAAATALRTTAQVPSWRWWASASSDCGELPTAQLSPAAGYSVRQADGAPDLAVVFGPDGRVACVDSIESLLAGYRFAVRGDGAVALVSVDWRALSERDGAFAGPDLRSLGGGDPEPQPMEPEAPRSAPLPTGGDPSPQPMEPDTSLSRFDDPRGSARGTDDVPTLDGIDFGLDDAEQDDDEDDDEADETVDPLPSEFLPNGGDPTPQPMAPVR